MTAPLYRWPETAAVGRPVPKTKFYEHAKVSASLREKFVSQVQRITWSYKLAENTIQLTGTGEVPEIQVFTVEAKDETIDDTVLGAIDRAVQTPVIFEVVGSDDGEARIRMAAMQKQADGTSPKAGRYFSTDWHPATAGRVPLPPALDLLSLYTTLLTPLLPIPARPGETLSEAGVRIDAIWKLEKAIVTLKRKMRSEPQLNRQMVIRRELRARQAELKALTGPTTTKDDTWRS